MLFSYNKYIGSLPKWILFYSLAGFTYYPEEKIAYQKKALTEEAKKVGVIIEKSVSGVSADEILKLIQKPSEEPYWKLRQGGAFQDIFFQTTLDRVPQFIGVMQEKAKQYGYGNANMGIYVQPMVQGTSCYCEIVLYYDPLNTEEVSKMKELYSKAGKALMDAGAFFNRPHGSLADEVFGRDPATTAALKKVKGIFDPENIMNAGKLCF